ncbi:hypothetical protein FH972_026134 [Carpinus fangiana]|uniref:Uncharacterized protein n=1 Tax=Carpinus fangiana TaxID=176857 RepID=A0A5N6L3K4_9ROSI|nr:hypothetical protein FH972_026134 [Carpinus fangiana]
MVLHTIVRAKPSPSLLARMERSRKDWKNGAISTGLTPPRPRIGSMTARRNEYQVGNPSLFGVLLTNKREDSGPLHIALIKIRALDSLDDNILSGLAQTLSQLSRLGLSCVIVLDSLREHSETGELDPKVQRQQNIEQADRFVRLIHGTTRVYACRVHNALGVIPRREAVDTTVRVRDAVEVQFRDMLLKPLRRGMIPIVPPLGYTTDTQTPVDLDANDVVLALARQFAGLREDHPTQGPGVPWCARASRMGCAGAAARITRSISGTLSGAWGV